MSRYLFGEKPTTTFAPLMKLVILCVAGCWIPCFSREIFCLWGETDATQSNSAERISSQSLLYASIQLDDTRKILSLIETLKNRPDLAGVCTSLTICPPRPLDASKGLFKTFLMPQLTSQNETLDACDRDFSAREHQLCCQLGSDDLSELFRSLPRLRRLQTGGFSWTALFPTLESATFGDLTRLHLEHTFLRPDDHPLRNLRNSIFAHQLQELYISEADDESAFPEPQHHLDSQASGDVPRLASWSSLQSLTLQMGSTVRYGRSNLISPTSIEELSKFGDHLTKLRLSMPAECCHLITRHMATCLPRLAELRVSLSNEGV